MRLLLGKACQHFRVAAEKSALREESAELHDCSYWTLSVMGVAGLVYDPDVPVTLMVYCPFGVPGFEVEPPDPFPPHEAIQSVETLRIAIKPSNCAPRSERLRE